VLADPPIPSVPLAEVLMRLPEVEVRRRPLAVYEELLRG
jgi:hypothetical protein